MRDSRPTPTGYPNTISAEWEAPWRTEHIDRVLESEQVFCRRYARLQNDTHSESDLYAAERFVYASIMPATHRHGHKPLRT